MLSYIELFQGNLREFISEGLQRGAQYLPMIQEEFREQGLPLDLAYIPLIESAFKNTARSRVKAQGMWQFMSYTGREHGLTLNWYVDERSDPEKATQAAAQVSEDARQDVRRATGISPWRRTTAAQAAYSAPYADRARTISGR